MHVTSPITVTISVTQELCQCAPELNHVRSILHETQTTKKIRSFSFPSFILMSILYHNSTPVRRESASASQRSFGNKIPSITGMKLHQISIQTVNEGLSPTLFQNNENLTDISGFLSNFIPNV